MLVGKEMFQSCKTEVHGKELLGDLRVLDTKDFDFNFSMDWLF